MIWVAGTRPDSRGARRGGAYLALLRWEGPGIPYADVPSSALSTGSATVEEVPALQFAETLVDSKFGLPSLRGASSASVLDQQSVARTNSNLWKEWHFSG